MYGKQSYISVNRLISYYFYSQKRQDTSDQVLCAFDGICHSILPPCRASLEMQAQRANYQAIISVSKWSKPYRVLLEIKVEDDGW